MQWVYYSSDVGVRYRLIAATRAQAQAQTEASITAVAWQMRVVADLLISIWTVVVDWKCWMFL